MIDVSELLTDPDFAQTFQVIRSTGVFANEGEYTKTQAEPFNMVGVIQPAAMDDVQFLPEGERTDNMIVAYSNQEIFASDALGRESDIILWGGAQYRVVQSKSWRDHGYWKVIAKGIQNANP